MIKRKKTKVHDYFEYECNHCGSTSQFKDLTELCEKKHGCTHGAVVYGFENRSDWLITKKCKYCEKLIGTANLHDVDNDNESIRAIFKIITSKVYNEQKI